MKNFQIIGVRPLDSCDEKYRKILKSNRLYQFDDRYNLEYNDKNEITGFTFSIEKDIIPRNFYSDKINIQVNAIVGGNGSGKSALAELFLYFMFYYGIKKELISKHQYPKDKSRRDETFKQANFTHEIKMMDVHLNVELLYIHDDIFYQVILKKNNFKIKKGYKENSSQFSLLDEVSFEKFTLPFYSMYVNYSHYGLNTNIDGEWLRTLFHKNDGYQLPVVINPYREKGNIDINIENYLSRNRVFTNFIDTEDESLILPNLKIDFIEVVRDGSKKTDDVYPKDYNLKDKDRILKPLYKIFFDDQDYPESLNENQIEVEYYLLRKIRTITERYLDYKQHNYLVVKTKPYQGVYKDELYEFFKQICQDRSHITLKIRQSLNFLRKDFYKIDHIEGKKNFKISDIINEINNIKEDDFFTETIDYLPPPIFMTRFHFKDKSHFDKLSSGEKQQIYSIHSIIYHLKNLDSVYNSANNKLKYNSVFLILDEIELYYHPQAQKKTIDRLLYALGKSKLINVNYLNIMFLTHSPFILSDIPTEFTLKLKEGKIFKNEKNNKTFAANVTDLLTDSFFLEKGLIGEFAKGKIEKTIKWINENQSKIDNNKDFNVDYDKYKLHQKIINIIDEPVLKIKLKEMLSSLNSDDRLSRIDEQIRILEAEKEQIKKNKDDIS